MTVSWIRPEMKVIGPAGLVLPGAVAGLVVVAGFLAHSAASPGGLVVMAARMMLHLVPLAAALVVAGSIGDDPVRDIQDATVTSSLRVGLRRWAIVVMYALGAAAVATAGPVLAGQTLPEAVRLAPFLLALTLCVTAVAGAAARLLGTASAAAPVAVGVWLGIELAWVRALGTGVLSAWALVALTAVVLLAAARTQPGR